MKVKTFEAHYELVEFNHYIDHDKKEPVSVVDLVVKSDNIEFIQKEFDNIFIVEADKLSYVFYNYELTECYEVGDGLIRVICVK